MFRRVVSRPSAWLIPLAAAAFIVAGRGAGGPSVQAQVNPNNPIAVENNQAGNPSTEWDVAGSGDPSIQGFATDISVNKGQTVQFKVKTDSSNYRIEIYRLGYYQGFGARRITTLGPFTQPQNQSVPCATDTTTGLVDCGNWTVTASWNTATTTAPSGIHLAKLIRSDGTGGSSHIVFIVRDDARQADVVVQTSDTTWQAYNRYDGGIVPNSGASLYCGGPLSNAGTVYSCTGRATKVSYNRPFDTRAHDPQSYVFYGEYPMVRWLEANGYDVKYISGVDTDRRAADLVGAQKPRTFLSVGHDEYWSTAQRASVEAARNAGVNLAFFSGNEMYWKTRFEDSIAGPTTAYRTLVSYKDTLRGVLIDPTGVATGTWRDTRFAGSRPENATTGTIFTVNSGTTAITVPASMANLRLWRNTRAATPTLPFTTLAANTLGYEWNEDLDNGSRPAGLIHLSSTTFGPVEKIGGFGDSVVPNATATHNLTMYRHTSGALVFSAGTVQWAWGLDANHDGTATVADAAMQQATVNLLADMAALPGSAQSGLILPTTADTAKPSSAVTSPANLGTVGSGDRITISGTASDSGGGIVAGVEVSVDGGATWRSAQGTTSWTYSWTPGLLGQVTIKSRAIDDSGNIETPGSGVTVTVTVGTCPCTTLFRPTATPVVASVDFDSSPVELGVKFTSDIAGTISGVRFYKGPLNTGTHIGNLWTSTGTSLASAQFTGESGSGWQEVTFSTPVPITANTTYVASYHTTVGAYAVDTQYFAAGGVDAPPLHAPPSYLSGGNGVFTYGLSAFPTSSFNATNYWVDVVFAPIVVDTTPPAISALAETPIDGSIEDITWTTNETSTSGIDYSIDASFPTAGTGSISDPAFVLSHTVRLTGLVPSTQYFYRVRSRDRSGNSVIAYPGRGSFTTLGPTLRDTTVANFSAGTPGLGAYLSEAGNGEVILAPAIGTEFSGSTMPPSWSTFLWAPPSGSAVVSGGRLKVDEARVSQDSDLSPQRVLEFVATFTGDPFQHSGFAMTLGGEPFAIFSTGAGQTLKARTFEPVNGESTTDLGPTFLGTRRFKIDWQPTKIDYYIDGELKASHAVAIGAPMRAMAASDFNPTFSGYVLVDWMRTTPYVSTGSFVSRVFDAGAPVTWQRVQWTSATPAGSAIAVNVCTSDSVAGSALVSPNCFLASSGTNFSATSRYVQYQATLTTSDPLVTPELSDITVGVALAPGTGTSGPLMVRPDFYSMDQAPGVSLQVLAPGVMGNDVSATSPGTVAAVVSGPAHGALALNPDGSFVYTPAAGFGGADSFTYRATKGLESGTAAVTIRVGANHTPVASDSTLTTNEDAPAMAGALTATDADADTLVYSIVANASLGTATITNAATGAFTYTPAANAYGPDSFTFRVNDGTENSNVATVSVTVNPVNDAPSFTKGANQTALANSGPKTVPNWATQLSAGPPNEAAQTLSFNVVTTTNAGVFSVQPAVAPNGTLTFTPAATGSGTATVSVSIKDSGSILNGGIDTSAPQTFTITVTAATVTSTTVVTSSNATSLFGEPITLTATIVPVSATGSVTFKDGTTTLGAGAITAGAAKITTASLAVGTHPITAVYGGSAAVTGSTSPVFTQTISASAKVAVTFAVQALQDDTKKPKVQTFPVPNALVKVFTTTNACVGNIFQSLNPKKWGQIFDGTDGVGGVDGCPVISVGTYGATGTTNAAGQVTITVPPLALSWTNQYIVIGRATNFDYVKTATSPEPLYSAYPVLMVAANTTRDVPLSLLATFNGKILPGKQTEFFGSYLNIVQPEYMDWTEDQEQYPFVMVAQGGWDVTTSVAPPEGFVPDAPAISTSVANATTAIQFTMTDVGSDWTETTVDQSIVHNGEILNTTSTIPMIDKKTTMARNDSRKVMHDSAATMLNVLINDKVNHLRKPLKITAVDPALNGTATLTDDGLNISYVPGTGYSGVDTFTYTVTDAIGEKSTATVSVTVLGTPEASVRNASVTEGDGGSSLATINVVLSNQSLDQVTVDYYTENGSAEGADYQATSGTVTFGPLVTSMPITVPILGDTLAEFNEKFFVRLRNATNATTAAAPGEITIIDDDPPEISIAPTASITEGNTGTNNVAVAVTLSQPHSESVWVNYATADGTAVAGSDYINTTGTLQFYPNTTTKTIYVPVFGDTVGEETESFYVNLSVPLNGTLTTSRSMVSIVNDDSSTRVFSTAADFGAGTLATGAYLSETTGGEIMLAPSQGAEFSGTSLPTGWTSNALAEPGQAVVANGQLSLDGAAVVASMTGSGATLEFVAAFSGAPNQSIGFGTPGMPGSPMAMFIIGSDRQLYVRSVNGAKIFESPMSGVSWLGTPLRYQITWNAGTVQYYINGTLMMTHSNMAWGAVQMRPTIVDTTLGDGGLSVDWIRSTPYAGAGTYTSPVFDAGASVLWQKLTTTSTVPGGTTSTIAYRTGGPDGNWTPFIAVGTGGALAPVSSQYLQFQIQMNTTSAAKTPVVQDVTVQFKK